VPEEHEALFRAARALIEEGKTDEDVIIPTLAFAAQSQNSPLLRHIRDRFAELEPGGQAWRELNFQFWYSLATLEGSLATLEVLLFKHDTLFLRAASLSVLVYKPNFVESITINVSARPADPLRPADPQRVETVYERALQENGVPQNPYELGLDEIWRKGWLRIMVRPMDPQIYDPTAHIIRGAWLKQRGFPPAGRVRAHYESAFRYASEAGFADPLDKKPGSGINTDNPLRAYTAWYVAGWDANSEQPPISKEGKELVDGYFDALSPPGARPVRSNLRKRMKELAPRITDVDAALRSEKSRRALARAFGYDDIAT
jgi:hypothetical protein